MGYVEILFEGLCTQVKLGGPLKTGDREVYHRAVLVHAEERRTIDGHEIPPHYAFLAIDELYIRHLPEITLPCLERQKDGNWRMNGARLHVENDAGGGVTYLESSYIYSLTELTPELGPLSPFVVYGSDAACHFDVRNGTFSGVRTPRGSRFTLLRIETAGDPRLVVEDMVGGGAATITLMPDAKIVVTHTGGKRHGDSRWDFLLHYLTAEKMPDDPHVPPDDAYTAPPGDGNEGLGPGCSNSIYP